MLTAGDQQQPPAGQRPVRGQLGVPRPVAVVRLSAFGFRPIITSGVLATHVGSTRGMPMANTNVTAIIIRTVLLNHSKRCLAKTWEKMFKVDK